MNSIDFVKGIGLGVMAGAAIGMAVVPKKKRTKNVVAKALRSAGDVVENVASVMGI